MDEPSPDAMLVGRSRPEGSSAPAAKPGLFDGEALQKSSSAPAAKPEDQESSPAPPAQPGLVEETLRESSSAPAGLVEEDPGREELQERLGIIWGGFGMEIWGLGLL